MSRTPKRTKTIVPVSPAPSELTLLQLHRFAAYWDQWHAVQNTTVLAPECIALESYLRAVGQGEKVDEIKREYEKKAFAGMMFLDYAVKTGVLPG